MALWTSSCLCLSLTLNIVQGCKSINYKSVQAAFPCRRDDINPWRWIYMFLAPRRSTSAWEPKPEASCCSEDATTEDAHPCNQSLDAWLNSIRLYNDWNFRYCIKICSISPPASPTRHQWGYLSRTPAPRRHSCFGARNGGLTFPALGWKPDDTLGWSSSSECGQQRLDSNMFSSSDMSPLRQRAGKQPALLWWIWSPADPCCNLRFKIHFKMQIQRNKHGQISFVAVALSNKSLRPLPARTFGSLISAESI